MMGGNTVEYWKMFMATLNIKKFPDALYNKLCARAESKHRSISQEVIHLINQVMKEPESHSILMVRLRHFKKNVHGPLVRQIQLGMRAEDDI